MASLPMPARETKDKQQGLSRAFSTAGLKGTGTGGQPFPKPRALDDGKPSGNGGSAASFSSTSPAAIVSSEKRGGGDVFVPAAMRKSEKAMEKTKKLVDDHVSRAKEEKRRAEMMKQIDERLSSRESSSAETAGKVAVKKQPQHLTTKIVKERS